MATVQEVLDFWLEELTEEDWYAGGEALDAQIRDRFMATWEEAAAGKLERWRHCAEGSLAYIIVTDQMSRNLWRGQAQAFATDALALRAAHQAVLHGWDKKYDAPARQFFYMPFCHSEILQDQERSVRLFQMRMGEGKLDHAQAHRWVIRKFGRFPYRNEVLGRHSTALEDGFIEAGGYKHALETVRAAA